MHPNPFPPDPPAAAVSEHRNLRGVSNTNVIAISHASQGPRVLSTKSATRPSGLCGK